MTNILKVCAALLVLAVPAASAFSLLGPYTSWQVTGIGYRLIGDIGGPMNEREGFRWNAPVITYAFDKSFIDYFGPDGVHAVDQAFQYFNDLPAASKISTNLDEYSQQTLRDHYEAAALGIMDLKSVAMAMIIEELGLAEPARWTFCLRNRDVYTVQNVTFTNYITIMRNFDPVTLQPSRYVNGTLFTYEIQDPAGRNPDYADAVEVVRFGDSTETLPVAQGYGAFAGQFRTGLTRDDVGGLRFMLHPNNIAVEQLLATVSSAPAGGGVASSAWIPYSGISNLVAVTNLIFSSGSNTLVDVGLRGGRNKLKFQRVAFDSLLGQTFTPITNYYTDVVVSSNFTMVVQRVARGITQPDFLFVAEDLGLIGNPGSPVLNERTGTGNWVDNDAINGSDETALSHGPGVISPSVRISFSDQLPYFENDTGSEFLDEDTAFNSGVWGSFDGTTNAPVIYPVYRNISIQQLRGEILGRSGGR
jgi:hypothetical protein